MRKRFLFFVLVAVLLCGGVLSACDEGPNEKEKTVVTYYLFNDTTPMTAVVFDGSFTFDRIPQKEHCTFLGLFDSKTGGTKVVDEYGNCNIVIQNSITLWAHWQGNNCNISFDAGDGTLPNNSSMSLEYGSATPDFPVPEQEGYTFVGWMNKGKLVSDGAKPKEVFFDDNSYTFEPDSDTVLLVAKYERRQFTITLDFNDDTYRTQTRTVNYRDDLGSVDLPQEDTGSREIVGWSLERDRYVPFTGTIDSDITLFAIWRDYKIFKFYTDSETYDEHRVYRDEEFMIPDAEKVGYRFDGWYDSPIYSGIPVERVAYGSAVTSYYAKWEAIQYHITFDGNGGDADLGQMSYTIEQEVTLPDAGDRQYCEFVGWCRNEDLSDIPVKVLPQGTYGDIVLYAKWKGEDRTVILDPEEGEVSNDTYTIEYGVSFRLPVPVREGYDFLGWYTDGGNKITDESGNGLEIFKFVERETTLYAHWQIKIYSVEYQTNGGSSVPAQEYEHGADLKFPDPPTKPNMELEGWYLDDELSMRAEEGTPVLGNMTLYAKWYQMTAINTAEDLKTIAEHPDYNYYLAADLNLGGVWTPIDNFSGVFDGKGHRIYNFMISSPNTVERLGFIATNRGEIKNLTLDAVVLNFSATDTCCSGLLVGYNYGKIENCSIVKNTVTLNGCFQNCNKEMRFGCIAGYSEGSIEGCSVSETSITGVHEGIADGWDNKYYPSLYVGGIVGEDNGSVLRNKSDVSIHFKQNSNNISRDSIWSGSIGCSVLSVGGIIGMQKSGGTMSGCDSEANISVVTGELKYLKHESFGTINYVGGLVGEVYGKVYANVFHGFLTTDAYSEGYVGGATGRLYGELYNCYAEAEISSGPGNSQVAGGFIGINYGTVHDCYSAGKIMEVKTSAAGFCGKNMGTGIINRCISLTKLECGGDNVAKFNSDNAGTVSNCYYADDVGASEVYAQDLGMEKAKQELLSEKFLIEELYWDSEIWNIEDNGETPPKLKWESEQI